MKDKGITLIALVVTIIVLLILASISMITITGQNGILTRAKQANEQTIVGTQKETIELAYTSAKKSRYTEGNNDLTEIIKNELSNNGYSGAVVIKSSNEYFVALGGNNYIIDANENVIKIKLLSEIDGEVPKSYVGYYADLNCDGRITIEDDGIIYADLAVSENSGEWTNGNGSYVYSAKSDLKEYYISNDVTTEDPFRTGKGIIKVIDESTKEDRFYVMALKDFRTDILNAFYWYSSANGTEMQDCGRFLSKKFGTGKENTRKMIARWNLGTGTGEIDGVTYVGYGSQNEKDLWGVIQNETTKGWFVPSRAEWSAFASNINISKNSTDDMYYENVGLKNIYWTSSPFGKGLADCVDFTNGYICIGNVFELKYVRLSRNF